MVSLWGLMLAESSLRSPQDLLLAGRQDAAFPGPMFHGVPFVYNGQLTGAAYFNSAATLTTYVSETTAPTGAGTSAQGPRVWAINGSVVNMVMHKDRVFYRLPPFSPDRQPFTKVMVTDCWYNLVNQNRRELGVLAPVTTNVTIPPAPSASV